MLKRVAIGPQPAATPADPFKGKEPVGPWWEGLTPAQKQHGVPRNLHAPAQPRMAYELKKLQPHTQMSQTRGMAYWESPQRPGKFERHFFSPEQVTQIDQLQPGQVHLHMPRQEGPDGHPGRTFHVSHQPDGLHFRPAQMDFPQSASDLVIPHEGWAKLKQDMAAEQAQYRQSPEG